MNEHATTGTPNGEEHETVSTFRDGKFTPSRIRVHHLRKMMKNHESISMLTAYDAVTARVLDAAGVEMLLVGDSIGNTMLGYSSTIPVTMEVMETATAAVMRGTERAFIVADLPFGSYEESPQQALHNAIRLTRAGADAVKLEGGAEYAPTIRTITQAGINVVAHIGYTPQSDSALGGPRVQGRDERAETRLKDDAIELEKAGAIAIVLEMIPASVSRKITEIAHIPTIGIGAGPHTSGQVLVWTDMAGYGEWAPKFVRKFGEVGQALKDAASAYREAVRKGEFPSAEHSF
ncbi:3-methyl-2-oxobutanoate hydroxymethyltransferase [Actinobaculum suis]|uniref:3-methyl-2-oxobutanoate hydroxymethyltransferase n=1 Tax=Actinobaculum suis TaxID=1657 RepID=UPI0009F57D50|nr:3-methyl-2-oxobutanoate hydroxymethyltransferase [Actinobaculum suis]